jgi:two-component system sensor histidine kinase KdpD
MPHGHLRIYLGMAPGVGKTYAMLGEGHRRAGRGTDVVVGFVEDYGRPLTRQTAEGLEAVPPLTVTHGDATFTEMDLDGLLARLPKVALVDEIAHINAPESRNERRWQDIDELLDAGVDVISTVDIAHLESLSDIVQQITGVRQRETVPDEVVRKADQIELVDMSPEALRRRMAHGNIYPAEKMDAALSNYFRVGNLTALRELALLWVADRVEEVLQRYRGEHGIHVPWPTRERVVVTLSGGPEGETLIRRGARIVSRAAGGELLAVHVTRSEGRIDASAEELARQRALVESLHGSYHTVVGDDLAEAVLDFARAVNATHIVVGESRRSRLKALFSRGVGATIVQGTGDNLDAYVVTHEEAARGRFFAGQRVTRGRRRSVLSGRRRLAGWVVAVAGPLLLTAVLANSRELHTLPIDLLLFLTLTVGVALLGGLWPAIVAAVVGSQLVNYYFTTPVYSFAIDDPVKLVDLVVFILVAGAVASVVDRAARTTEQAARTRAEADTLSTLAGSILSGEDALPAMLRHAQETFGMSSVTLFERAEDDRGWRCIAYAGDDPCETPEQADVSVPLAGRLTLALRGRKLPAEQHRVLIAFTAQVSQVFEQERLREAAATAGRLAEGDRVRTALLTTISRNLRTPLASIRVAVSALRQEDVAENPTRRAKELATIEEGSNRLDRLIADLLDMSRLQAGAVRPEAGMVNLDEVLQAATRAIPRAEDIRLDLPDTLPPVMVDRALLERVLTNVMGNAVMHTPAGTPITISAGVLRNHVEVRIADRGPGVPDADKEQLFEPFQRQEASRDGAGVGLGLAVARGFTEAIGGTLVAEDTPGGGLTMVLSVPFAEEAPRRDTAAAGRAVVGSRPGRN